jgi:hypothetical protein
MSGNVGGRGDYDAIKENTSAINTAESNRAKDSLKLRDTIKDFVGKPIRALEKIMRVGVEPDHTEIEQLNNSERDTNGY